MKCPKCGVNMIPLPIKEDRPLNPGNIYGLSKLDTESICLNLSRSWGFPTVVFRPFGVFGPGQSLGNPYTGVLALFATWVFAGQSIRHYEDGLQKKGYIYELCFYRFTKTNWTKKEGFLCQLLLDLIYRIWVITA